jgi:hypothetical protein
MTTPKRHTLRLAALAAALAAVLTVAAPFSDASAKTSTSSSPSSSSSFRPSSSQSMGLTKKSLAPSTGGSQSMGFVKKDIPSDSKPAPTGGSQSMGMVKKDLPGAASPSTAQAAPAAPQPAASSAMGMTKKPVDSPVAATAAPRSAFDQAAAKSLSQQSLARYEADKQRTKLAAQPIDTSSLRSNPAYSSVRSSWRSADDYYAARARHYDVIYHSQPQTVIYVHQSLHPNYGFWDGMFLAMLLSHNSDPGYAEWAYAHRYDPAYQQWHNDAMALSEQNGELRAQIAALDGKVAAMQASSTQPQAANILPPGVDQSVAIAPEAVQADSFAASSTASAMTTPEHHSSAWKWVLAIVLVGGIGYVVIAHGASIWRAILRLAVR